MSIGGVWTRSSINMLKRIAGEIIKIRYAFYGHILGMNPTRLTSQLHTYWMNRKNKTLWVTEANRFSGIGNNKVTLKNDHASVDEWVKRDSRTGTKERREQHSQIMCNIKIVFKQNSWMSWSLVGPFEKNIRWFLSICCGLIILENVLIFLILVAMSVTFKYSMS